MSRNRFLAPVMSLAVAAFFGTGAALAAQPRLIANHDKWGSYVIEDKDGKVCYMASSPDKHDRSVSGKSRGDIYALVTDRPSEGTRNVFTYISGYRYKPGSQAMLTIDKGKPIPLFTKDDSAWANKSSVDDQIVKAMRSGKSFSITGVSAHGTRTTDTFSLKGAVPAYQDISRACPLK